MLEKKPNKKLTERIPVFDSAGVKRNKNLQQLKQALLERDRGNSNDNGPKTETLYVDTTRNVGVVLGENFLNPSTGINHNNLR